MLGTREVTSAFLAVIATAPLAEGIGIEWWDAYGEPYADWANAIATDASGSVIVCGSVQVAPNSYDFATLKYAPDGTRAWARRFNGLGDRIDKGQFIDVDGFGNIYVAGLSWSGGDYGTGPKYDIVTLKYSPAGDLLWTHRFNGPGNNDDTVADLVVLPDGTAYTVGWSRSAAGTAPDADYVINKITPEGTLEWSRFYSGPESEIGWLTAAADADESGIWIAASVEVTGNNGLFGAYGIERLAPDGSVQWSGVWVPPEPPFIDFNIIHDATMTPDGGFVIAGRADDGTESDSPADAVLVRCAASGGVLWSATNRTLRTDEFNSVTVDDAGNVFAAGSFNIETDAILHAEHLTAAYDASGNFMWEHRFGGTTGVNFDGEGIAAVNPSGELVIATRNINETTLEDMRVFVYDRMTGEILRTVLFDASYDDMVLDMTLDGAGNIYLAGRVRPVGVNQELAVVKIADAPALQVCAGDVDGDGDADVLDFAALAPAFGTKSGEPGYAVGADLDGDGDVDIFDFGTLATDFGCGP